MLTRLVDVADFIDGISRFVGKTMSLAMPVVVLIGACVAMFRYAFSVGYPWLSESFVWLNGAAFVLASAWLLADDKHVRVDVVYRSLTERGRAIVNIFGSVLFLWPTVSVIAWYGYSTVIRSWGLLEKSPTIDGLPVLYLLKTSILVFCGLLFLQSISLICRSVVVLGLSRQNPSR